MPAMWVLLVQQPGGPDSQTALNSSARGQLGAVLSDQACREPVDCLGGGAGSAPLICHKAWCGVSDIPVLELEGLERFLHLLKNIDWVVSRIL